MARLAALYHNALVEANHGPSPPEPAADEGGSEDGGAEDLAWNPAEYGDRAYFDESFQLNEDLLPWNMAGIQHEEHWGI